MIALGRDSGRLLIGVVGGGGAMRIFVVLIEHKHNQFLKKLHNDD